MKNGYLYLIPFIIMLTMVSCSDEDGAVRVLKEKGYTNIQTDGFAFTGCLKNEPYKTSFQAKNPQGKRVSGSVCCGPVSGCTLRNKFGSAIW